MKGQRRHELEKNELADWLAGAVETVRPYQSAILGVVILLLVAAAGFSWWTRRAAATDVAAWNRFNQAMWQLTQGEPRPIDFEDIVEAFPDSEAAPWARVTAADLHLALGCGKLFTDKALGQKELRDAADGYRAILDNGSSNAEIRQRATFGLARAREAQGNLTEAAELYEALGRDWPEGVYADVAARRLDDIKRPQTRQLYDRLAKSDPEPASSPDTFPAGNMPSFDLDNLPDDGPVFEPSLMDLEEKGAPGAEPEPSPITPVEPDATEPGFVEPGAVEPDAPVEPGDTVEPSDPGEPISPTEPTDTEPATGPEAGTGTGTEAGAATAPDVPATPAEPAADTDAETP